MNAIFAFSIILWIFIDRFKAIWHDTKYGKYITTAVALASGLLISFFYNLDILVAIGIEQNVSIGGMIFAGLSLAGGSSCIHELIEKIGSVKE